MRRNTWKDNHIVNKKDKLRVRVCFMVRVRVCVRFRVRGRVRVKG